MLKVIQSCASFYACHSLYHYVLFPLKDNFLFHIFLQSKVEDCHICLQGTYILSFHSFYNHQEKMNWYNLAKFFIQTYILGKQYNKIHTQQYSKYAVRYVFLCFWLILLAEYVEPQKNQSTQLYFLLISKEAECVSLLCLSSKFMTYTPSFILGKLSLEKNTIKPKFVTGILSNLYIA